jgi:hypothetical protein
MRRGVAFVTAVSVIAVLVVAGFALIPRSNVSVAPGSRLVWPRGPSAPPRLGCDGWAATDVYDGPGIGTRKNPKDAVIDALPLLSSTWSGYTRNMIAGITRGNHLVPIWRYTRNMVAGITRGDLVPIWHHRDDRGAATTFLLRVDGSYVAEFDVARSLFAEGQPIRWRDSGWVVVGGSAVCDLLTSPVPG